MHYADEYLRLSYHGLRAKDKSFNAKFETNFDSTIGKNKCHTTGYWPGDFEFDQQCILCCDRKKKQLTWTDYEPTVSVSTKKLNAARMIRSDGVRLR